MASCKPQTVGELQLYKVLQRANLLQYYDTFISQGGDDVAQLCEAGEEEFLEIMSLVGMATKPLHVRRLQKALQEWVTKPKLFKNISLNYRPVQSRPLSSHTPLVDDAMLHRHTPPSTASRLVTPPRPHSNKESNSAEDNLHGFSSKTPTNDTSIVFDPLGTPSPEQIGKVANRLQAFGEHSLALALQLNERESVMRETRKYVETIFQKSKQHSNASTSMHLFAFHLAVNDCRYLLRPDDLLSSAAKLEASANEASDKLPSENSHQLFINQHKTAEIEKRLKIINVQREAFERKVTTADNPTQATEYQSELSRLTQEKFSLLQKKSELQRNYAVLSASMGRPPVNHDEQATSEAHDLSIKSPSSNNPLSEAVKHENNLESSFPINDDSSLKRSFEEDEDDEEQSTKLIKRD